MRRVIKTGLASIAVGVMGATLLGTAPAQAATTTATGGGAHRVVTQAMTVTGFNVKVAAAHGYEIRTTPSGVQYSVKKGTPSTATPSIAHPNTTIGGNCGSSYIDYNAVGNLSVKVKTGFNVDEAGHFLLVAGRHEGQWRPEQPYVVGRPAPSHFLGSDPHVRRHDRRGVRRIRQHR